MRTKRIKGISESFSHRIEWGAYGWDEHRAVKGISPALRATDYKTPKYVWFIKETDMRQRDFHRRCRVIYRAMRKMYGIEKVQDECLKVFKVFFPVYYRAKNEDITFTGKDIERTRKIFESWNIIQGSELDILLGTILSEMEKGKKGDELIQFCDDVMVVVMKIRKLTPRECGRLMAVDEKSLDTMINCGVSKSALYKLFGNSIVAGTGTKDSKGNYDGVLFNIFRKMFIEQEPDMVKGEAHQLSLF